MQCKVRWFIYQESRDWNQRGVSIWFASIFVKKWVVIRLLSRCVQSVPHVTSFLKRRCLGMLSVVLRDNITKKYIYIIRYTHRHTYTLMMIQQQTTPSSPLWTPTTITTTTLSLRRFRYGNVMLALKSFQRGKTLHLHILSGFQDTTVPMYVKSMKCLLQCVAMGVSKMYDELLHNIRTHDFTKFLTVRVWASNSCVRTSKQCNHRTLQRTSSIQIRDSSLKKCTKQSFPWVTTPRNPHIPCSTDFSHFHSLYDTKK